MAAIVCEQLTKRYGDLVALDQVSFEIPPGQLVALLGPNGAGKTTTLELLEGFLHPTAGSIRVLGADPRRADRAWRARIGLVLQSTSLDGQLTVRELLGVFAQLYPDARAVPEVLELLGLTGEAGTRVDALSGGQRRRVDVALGIVGRPELLFLDEPTTGLDPEARRRAWVAVQSLASTGTTVVLTTHYLEEADALADRVVVIDRGRVLAEGTAAAIKARVGRKRVRFATPHRVEPALFDGLPVEGLSTQDGVTTLLTPRPEGILRRLFEAGTDVSELEVVGADLEEAFLEITRKGRDEEEGPL
jgi:ABC-2 type transport system ATP-binding protein